MSVRSETSSAWSIERCRDRRDWSRFRRRLRGAKGCLAGLAALRALAILVEITDTRPSLVKPIFAQERSPTVIRRTLRADTSIAVLVCALASLLTAQEVNAQE